MHAIGPSVPSIPRLPREMGPLELVAITHCALMRLIRISHYMEVSKESRFLCSGIAVPRISLSDYIGRIVGYLRLSEDVMVIAIRYLVESQKRVGSQQEGYRNFVINANTVYKLFFTAVVLAHKFQEDTIPNDAYFAEVGGISTEELYPLEAAFCNFLGWKLFVSPSDYVRCRQEMIKQEGFTELMYTMGLPPHYSPESGV